MKANQQSNEFINQWWENQQKLFNQWWNIATPKSDTEAPVVELFKQAAQSQEKLIDFCLEAQASWSQQVRDVIDQQEQLPDTVKISLVKVQTINDGWRELRQQLWHSWFGMIKSADSASLNSGMSEYTDKVLETCQESARQILKNSTLLAEPVITTKPAPKKESKEEAKAVA